MSDETKALIQFQLGILQEILKEEKVAMGVLIDKVDNSKSQLCFIDFDVYMKTGKHEGITVNFDDFNKDLYKLY